MSTCCGCGWVHDEGTKADLWFKFICQIDKRDTDSDAHLHLLNMLPSELRDGLQHSELIYSGDLRGPQQGGSKNGYRNSFTQRLYLLPSAVYFRSSNIVLRV